MSEQEPKYPELHITMSNLKAAGMSHHEVLSIGWKCAKKLAYHEAFDKAMAQHRNVARRYDVDAYVRASEMLLEEGHRLGLSVQAIKERIGR